MLIELDGEIGEISYRGGGWRMQVELRQPLPHDGKAGYPNSDPYRILGSVELRISKDDANEIMDGPIEKLKLLVEIAKE